MREEAYRIFVTEMLKVAGSKIGISSEFKYSDLLQHKEVDNRTSDEIIQDIRSKLN